MVLFCPFIDVLTTIGLIAKAALRVLLLLLLKETRRSPGIG